MSQQRIACCTPSGNAEADAAYEFPLLLQAEVGWYNAATRDGAGRLRTRLMMQVDCCP
jgi:hypothetical protein